MINRMATWSLWFLASVTGFVLAWCLYAHDWLKPCALRKKSNDIDPAGR